MLLNLAAITCFIVCIRIVATAVRGRDRHPWIVLTASAVCVVLAIGATVDAAVDFTAPGEDADARMLLAGFIVLATMLASGLSHTAMSRTGQDLKR